MYFVETEDGKSMNIALIFTFEDFRGRKTKCITEDGEEAMADIPYEQFKTLVGMAQSKQSSMQKDLRTVAQNSFQPRP